jgi:hypothetical protein
LSEGLKRRKRVIDSVRRPENHARGGPCLRCYIARAIPPAKRDLDNTHHLIDYFGIAIAQLALGYNEDVPIVRIAGQEYG